MFCVAAAAGQMYGVYVCWCIAATAANSLGDKVNIRMNVSGWMLCDTCCYWAFSAASKW
jgi:hypothetical protein